VERKDGQEGALPAVYRQAVSGIPEFGVVRIWRKTQDEINSCKASRLSIHFSLADNDKSPPVPAEYFRLKEKVRRSGRSGINPGSCAPEQEGYFPLPEIKARPGISDFIVVDCLVRPDWKPVASPYVSFLKIFDFISVLGFSRPGFGLTAALVEIAGGDREAVIDNLGSRGNRDGQIYIAPVLGCT